MKKNISGLLLYLVAFGLLIIGLGVVYYAFELVSVPHAREYNESGWIIIGLILVVVGAGLGVYKIKKAKRQPVASQTAEPQAG